MGCVGGWAGGGVGEFLLACMCACARARVDVGEWVWVGVDGCAGGLNCVPAAEAVSLPALEG